MNSFYRGPGPRLRLSEWGEVEIAAAAGLLAESAWVELKAMIRPGAHANRELAKDLASLSVDGGLLIVGVSDALEVDGFAEDPHALRTRVIQVAAAAVTPALFVEVHLISGSPASSDEQRCLAVVAVPASGSAPHMVQDQYWGRSAEGKRPLSDAEVERLISERRMRARSLEQDLRLVEKDLGHLVDGQPAHSHVVFAARPRGASGVILTDALEGQFPPQVLNLARDFEPSWAPWSSPPGQHQFHPDGILFSSDDPRFGRAVDEQSALRILLRDDGGVLAASGGASYPITHHRLQGTEEAVVCGALLEGVHVLTRLAAYVASEYLAYWGEWEVGLLVTDLRGRWATDRYTHGDLSLHPYPADDYLRWTSTSTSRMLETPAEVVGELVLPLLRSLGVSRRWLPYERGHEIRDRRG